MLRIFLIGFGNVGRELVRLLFTDLQTFRGFNPENFSLTAITTRSHGNLFSEQGIDGALALNHFKKYGRFTERCSYFTAESTRELLGKFAFDVLVDLTPLELENRALQSTERLDWALQNGKHVVTANKGPVAFQYERLMESAKSKQVQFLFESTVMDGTPLFNLYKYSLRGAKIVGFEGVLNSTTNFLLNQMEQGASREQALARARQMGMVEADADHDLQGWDAALKTAILANVFFEHPIDPLTITRDSFDLISAEKIAQAARQNRRWKFIASARQEGGEIQARVQLQQIASDHPFWGIEGSSSVLQLHFEKLATLRLVQHKPTITDTAYGVIHDLLEIKAKERTKL